MNGRASKLIHEYAATYASFGSASAGTMERIAKRDYRSSSVRRRRELQGAWRQRIINWKRQQAQIMEARHAAQSG